MPFRSLGPARLSALLALPLLYAAAATWLRIAAGPDWLWFNVDPTYFYFFDALNILELTPPGHIFHPGIPVQWLGALFVRLAHPFSAVDAIVADALADPESVLRLMSYGYIAMNAVALAATGVVVALATERIAAAFLVQLAPFLSTLILKNSVFAKPESLELFATLLLIAVGFWTLRRPADAHDVRPPIAFGLVAGFGVATKITMAPIFVLPLVVLGTPRRIAIYGVAAFLSLVLFAAPALPMLPDFVAWIAKIGGSTGPYGAGAGGLIDLSVYPKSVLRLLKRPLMHGAILLAMPTLVIALVRHRRGADVPKPELRLLAGILAAQIAQTLIVAKQPSAHYMIPSYILSAAALAAVWLTWLKMCADARMERRLRLALAGILPVVLALQLHATWKTEREFTAGRELALAVDNDRFEQCARVTFTMASSLSYALMNGDFITGGRFKERLAAIGPKQDFWLEHSWHWSPLTFRSWRGEEDISATLARFPCAVFRGSLWSGIEAGVAKMTGGMTFDANCSFPGETVLVKGADCAGKLR